jgi:hypothetical protein
MKHIEASQLIRLTKEIDAGSIKYSLVERLRGAFHVETVGEGVENFVMTAEGKYVPCTCSFSVLLKTEDQRARIIIDGSASICGSTKILYTLGFLALLVLGLFPGTINTTGMGGAIDFMVFLFLGAFLVLDLNKKLSEPQELIDRILKAVDTEFGS